MMQANGKLRMSFRAQAIFILWTTAVFLIITSCESVKPYQRAYLNDREMKPGMRNGQKFEEHSHAYREGSSGGGSTKTSGGCGCN
jgi:hypothetical protein